MSASASEDESESGSTDAERDLVELTDPRWRVFERDVADLIQQLDRTAAVRHNEMIRGRCSGRPRQVDVFVSGSIGGEELTIAIECKRYTKPIGIGGVDEFAGKLLDLGVERGVLYAVGGFTAGAQARAKGALQPKIVLRNLASEAPKPPWQPGLPQFTGFGDCPNENCFTGDITWQEWPQDGGEVIEAGSCDICGTWAVRCSDCGAETGFFGDEVNCDGCERRYALVWDRKDGEVDDVVGTE